jgi:3-hydroxyisobutyrate dehydrogenase
MVRMYYPEPITKVQVTKSAEEVTRALKLVTDMMTFTNICAAAEAIAFARYLKVDMQQFYDLVVNAAGGSKIFSTLGAKMIQGIESGEAPAGTPRIDDVVSELSNILQQARDLQCPLNLATEALNLFLFAQRAGWGAEASTSVLKVWEK